MSMPLKRNCLKELNLSSGKVFYYSIKELSKQFPEIDSLPFSLKVLLENLLRHEDQPGVNKENIGALAQASASNVKGMEIAFRPARVLMQDFTGVPAVVDLAAMRDAMVKLDKDPSKINPLSPVDLVIDHSVMVDFAGDANAFEKNVKLEFSRNAERYSFLKWGAKAFNNFRVVPPGTGICHQVNLEYLAKTIWTKEIKGKLWHIKYPICDSDEYLIVATTRPETMLGDTGVAINPKD